MNNDALLILVGVALGLYAYKRVRESASPEFVQITDQIVSAIDCSKTFTTGEAQCLCIGAKAAYNGSRQLK